jgi:hypothetical protein
LEEVARCEERNHCFVASFLVECQSHDTFVMVSTSDIHFEQARHRMGIAGKPPVLPRILFNKLESLGQPSYPAPAPPVGLVVGSVQTTTIIAE